MHLNNLFHEATYDRVVRAFREQGSILIEQVPEASEISTFLDTLSFHSELPLADRLYFSPRDGSIALHRIDAHDVVVSLLNVTQDYTFRCTDTFVDGWRGHFSMGARSSVRHPHLLPTIMPLLDELQRYILSARPSYLHQVRKDTLIDPECNSSVTVYTLEVAHRYRPQGEARLPYLDMTAWPLMNDFRRRRATPSQITVWALLTLTPTDACMDDPRLEAIGRAILAATAVVNHPPVVVPPGNLMSLLRVRHAAYMDGRARYALIRAVVTSRSLLQYNDLLDGPSDYGLDSLEDKQDLPERKSNINVIAKVLTGNFLTTSLGLLYLIRLRDPNSSVEEVVGVSLAIIAVIFPASMVLWVRVFTGSTTPNSLLRLRRPINANEMYKMTANGNSRLRVDAATSNAAVNYYNGKWLSFSGLHYVQNGKEYPGRFSLQDLLRAGYQTTFALDGREVLISPCGERRMRMLKVDANGVASFSMGWKEERTVRDDDDFEKGMEVIPCARGVWSTYVKVG